MILWLLAGTALAAFVAPREGGEPFRRERVPLDVDTMNQLSRQLGFLAASVERAGPEGQRLRAQLLGMARVLDPANRAAREMLRELGEGREIERSHEMDFQRVLAAGWELEEWLSSEPAGVDGRALGACLREVLGELAPDHPRAVRADAQAARWDGWVAPPEAFVDPPEPGPAEPPPPKEAWKPALEVATADFPVVLLDREKNETRVIVASLVARAVAKPNQGGRLEVEFGSERATAAKLAALLGPLLERRHGEEVRGMKLVFSLPKGVPYSTARNDLVLSGAAFLAGEALITGKLPTAVVLAEVGADGSLGLPQRFWELLARIESLDGRRWLMPAKAVDRFPAMLTLGRSGFFMKHEVLLAKDADGLASLAPLPLSGEMPEALARFEEIQRVGKRSSLGSFVANPHTQARLRQVVADEPRHASARMLAQRGTPGGWPRFLPREVAASELLRAIEPIGKAINVQPILLREDTIDRAVDECREQLDEIHSVLELDDRELHEAVEDLLKPVAQVTKSVRKKTVQSDGSLGRAVMAYRGLLARLRVEAGLPPK